jgi:hypothetical protein
MRTALYRHFDADGRLLYVGISMRPFQRLYNHDRSHWSQDIATVRIEWFYSRKEALQAELRAITTENPAHNLAGLKPPKKTPPQRRERASLPLSAEDSRRELMRVFAAAGVTPKLCSRSH